MTCYEERFLNMDIFFSAMHNSAQIGTIYLMILPSLRPGEARSVVGFVYARKMKG